MFFGKGDREVPLSCFRRDRRKEYPAPALNNFYSSAYQQEKDAPLKGASFSCWYGNKIYSAIFVGRPDMEEPADNSDGLPKVRLIVQV